MPFHPYFSYKDIVGFIILLMLLNLLTLWNPYLLVDPDNFIPANPLVTPAYIQPEWYFLYGILRSIPNKLGEVIALVMSIAILMIMPFYNLMKFRGIAFYPIVILLTWIGARTVESPFVITGQMLTVLYFMYYLINPLISKWWDKLLS